MIDKEERKKEIARQRLIEAGLSEKLLDSKDIITDKYAICIGWFDQTRPLSKAVLHRYPETHTDQRGLCMYCEV